MYLKQRMEYIRIHTEYTTIHVSTPSHMARPVRLWDTPGYNRIQQDTSARAYPGTSVDDAKNSSKKRAKDKVEVVKKEKNDKDQPPTKRKRTVRS